MSDTILTTNYTQAQKEAIDTIDQNLQIIACAGSGKTQVISQRIINILSQGVPPAAIIAFTYTEKAAAELKNRVLKLCREQLGDTINGLAEMYIGTIHSWCLNVLQDHKYEYQKFSVLDEVKLKLFIDREYRKIGMTDLGMDRFKDTGHFIALMGILREAELIPDAQLPEELQTAQQRYENTLEAHAYFDFTMIMTRTIAHLNDDPVFIDRITRHLQYLIVDEYQDVNPVQEQIIKRLSDLGANVCVVGDDDQTIYQWRGSDIQYIQNFTTRYPDVKYVAMQDNFRSTQGIIDLALTCIEHNQERLPKGMIKAGHQQYQRGDILYHQFQDVDEENQYIARSIVNLRGTAFQDKATGQERGLDYSDMVILLRKWKKAEPITQALRQAGIPFIVKGVNQLFDQPEVQAAKAIFQFLDGQFDRSALALCWEDLSDRIDPTRVQAAIEYLERNIPTRDTYYERFILQDIFWEFLDRAGISEDLFEDPNQDTAVGYEAEEIIFYNLGMFSQIIDDFETIYFRSRPDYKLTTFLNFLRYSAEGYYPEGWLNNTYRTPNAVQIMTVFQAKGLEFPVVFVPGLTRNYLPSKRPGGRSVWHFLERSLVRDQQRYEVSTEAERRLLYVAITRAEKFLFLSWAPDAGNRLYRRESPFGPELRKSDYQFSSPNRDWSDRPRTTPQSKTEIANISLNFSLLKDFFDCPYRFKFYTFYGFRNPLGARMGFGKSIHNVLMEIHRNHLEGQPTTPDDISALLDRHLHFPNAHQSIREDMTERARLSTTHYLEQNQTEFDQIEFAEKEVQIDLGDGILVNGRMDLIKKKNLDGTEETTIIDFKSKQNAQDENVTFDQLALYALGYQELSGNRADFLEIYNLDDNDRKKEELLISDLNEIRDKIIHAANEIRGNQLDHRCNDPKCPCRFKQR